MSSQESERLAALAFDFLSDVCAGVPLSDPAHDPQGRNAGD